jgi:hypothetical protein
MEVLRVLIKSFFQNIYMSYIYPAITGGNLPWGWSSAVLPSGFEKDLPTALYPTGVPAGRSGGKSLS